MAGSDSSEPMSRVTYRSNVVTAVPDPTSVVGSSGSIDLTLTVDQAGGTVSVDTNCRTTIASPSGNWPHTHEFPLGQGTTAVITLTTSSVPSSSAVSIRACTTELDINDPASWQATASVTIQPLSDPHLD